MRSLRFHHHVVLMLDTFVRSSRPVLKLFGFAAVMAVCILGYLFLLSLFRNHLIGNAVAAGALAVVCLALNAVFLRREGWSLASIGLVRSPLPAKQLVVGFAAGTALVGGWLAVALGVTSASLRLGHVPDLGASLALIAFYFFNNAAEELAYRAYAFLALEAFYGRVAALAITSVAFTLLHMQGGMPLLQALTGTLSNALVFGAVFHAWKSLPLTLGLHLATNLMQDIVGMRGTAITLLDWSKVDTSGLRGPAILVLVAGINLAVAALVYRCWSSPNLPAVNVGAHQSSDQPHSKR